LPRVRFSISEFYRTPPTGASHTFARVRQFVRTDAGGREIMALLDITPLIEDALRSPCIDPGDPPDLSTNRVDNYDQIIWLVPPAGTVIKFL